MRRVIECIKWICFIIGWIASARFPSLFYPLCIQSWPLNSLIEWLVYFLLISLSIYFESLGGLLCLCVCVLLVLRGSIGSYTVDHLIILVVSWLMVHRVSTLVVWGLYLGEFSFGSWLLDV